MTLTVSGTNKQINNNTTTQFKRKSLSEEDLRKIYEMHYASASRKSSHPILKKVGVLAVLASVPFLYNAFTQKKNEPSQTLQYQEKASNVLSYPVLNAPASQKATEKTTNTEASSNSLSINGKSIVVLNQPYKNNIKMLNSLSKTFKNNPALQYAMMTLLKTEGIRSKTYDDTKKLKTVGVGHLIKKSLQKDISDAKKYLANSDYKDFYKDVSVKVEEKTTKDGKKIQVLSDKQIEMLFASDLLEHSERAKNRIGKNWEYLSDEKKAAATAYTYQIYPKKFMRNLRKAGFFSGVSKYFSELAKNQTLQNSPLAGKIATKFASISEKFSKKYIQNSQKECDVVQWYINNAEKRFAEMLFINNGEIHESVAEMLHNKIKETPEGEKFKTKEESLNFLWEKRFTQEERDMLTQINCDYKGVVPKEKFSLKNALYDFIVRAF